MRISVIIPTLNEQDNLGPLINHLLLHGGNNLADITVVDANSTDRTPIIAIEKGCKLIETKQKSRGHQMNRGAKEAKGDILYFVHADAFPPTTFIQDIMQYHQKGYPMGCYRFRFKSKHPLLRVNSFFTRFRFLWCRGGDQTLYVKKDFFEELNGFDEEYVVMEDFDLIKRARKRAPFVVMSKSVEVSARKYALNSYFRVNIANLIVFIMFQLGYAPEKLKQKYYTLINHPKGEAKAVD
jgi:rSAM/selenodomain-associated transferase 2